MTVPQKNILQIGYKIKAFREANHLTQEQLAELMKCSFKTIGNIENDRVVPDLRQVINLCDILNVSLDELFTGVLTKKEDVAESLNKKEPSPLWLTERMSVNSSLSKNARQKIETIYMKIRNMNEKEISLIEDIIEAMIKNRL